MSYVRELPEQRVEAPIRGEVDVETPRVEPCGKRCWPRHVRKRDGLDEDQDPDAPHGEWLESRTVSERPPWPTPGTITIR
jgi:hypothetical protein